MINGKTVCAKTKVEDELKRPTTSVKTSCLLNSLFSLQRAVARGPLSLRGRSLSPSLISTLFLPANIWQISRKVLFLVSGTTSQM